MDESFSRAERAHPPARSVHLSSDLIRPRKKVGNQSRSVHPFVGVVVFSLYEILNTFLQVMCCFAHVPSKTPTRPVGYKRRRSLGCEPKACVTLPSEPTHQQVPVYETKKSREDTLQRTMTVEALKRLMYPLTPWPWVAWHGLTIMFPSQGS